MMATATSLPLVSLEQALRVSEAAPTPPADLPPAPRRPGDSPTPPRAQDEMVLYGRLGYILRSSVPQA